MSSSTSNSDGPAAWKRFFVTLVGGVAIAGLLLYGFVALLDPWDSLPLSPGWQRGPVARNARFAYPALARMPRFDSAVFGTSTSRLLRPALLDASFGAAFANLSMDSATPYEQSRLLDVFLRHHPRTKIIMFGLDFRWCATGSAYDTLTFREFPSWLYEESLWSGYLHLFSFEALEAAVQQLAFLLGRREPSFGLDGYANFLPDDGRYELARAARKLGREGPPPDAPPDEPVDQPSLQFPAHDVLARALQAAPADTLKILFITPLYHGDQPAPSTDAAAVWSACKYRLRRLSAEAANTSLIDFMIPSPITANPENYWDPLHYRVAIADRLVSDLAQAATSGADSSDYRVLDP